MDIRLIPEYDGASVTWLNRWATEVYARALCMNGENGRLDGQRLV